MNDVILHPQRLRLSEHVFGVILVCLMAEGGPSEVLAQDRGNTSAQEYGDAVYRKLEGFWTVNYNHAAIFSGLNGSHSGRVTQALGSGSTTHETSFVTAFTDYGNDYYGAYTLVDRSMSFTDRKNVVKIANDLVNALIPYPSTPPQIPLCLVPIGSSFDGSVGDISNIRCDGFVEYSYEKNGFRVWRNQSYPDSAWSIVSNLDYHNDRPDLTRNPEREMSPWAQRGAPCNTGPGFLGCSYSAPDTKMNRAAVINLPKYEVTKVDGNGYADVTIRATDESGIHYIRYKKPGDVNWVDSQVQSQHPTSDSYSLGPIRITSSGTLFVYAMDNGGNAPSPANAPGYTINVTTISVPTIRTDPASVKSSTSAILNATITDTGGTAVTDRRFEWGTTPSPDGTWTATNIRGIPIAVSGNSFSADLSNLSPNRGC